MSQCIALLAALPSPSVVSFALFGLGMVVFRLVTSWGKTDSNDR